MKFQVKTLLQGDSIAVVTVNAATARDAERHAQVSGQTVLSVVRQPFQWRIIPSRTPRFPLLLFSQEFLSLLNSGIPVFEAIETLAEKEGRPAVRGILEGMMVGLKEGRTLSSTLEEAPQAFPPLFAASMRASERTSGLPEALERYIKYANQLETLRGKLVSAAIYPALLTAVSVLVILFLLGYVVPRFSHIYEDMGGNLPIMSRILLNLGLWVEQYWLALIVGSITLLGVAVNGGGRLFIQWLVRQLWRNPVLGEQLRIFHLSRMYRTLGMLLRGGIAIVPAMEMVAGMLSDSLQLRLWNATRAIREGLPVSVAFESHGLTTAVALRMFRVGERAGNIGEMMERAATFHDDEASRWAEWATRLLGPLFMLLMGLVIGAIVVLMYLPIFQLAESIQ